MSSAVTGIWFGSKRAKQRILRARTGRHWLALARDARDRADANPKEKEGIT